MRIKKTVATFVAATMLFGSVGSAFAATVDDSSNRLLGLGLVTGYEDGSLKPDQPITRAEYAAIAVRALGLETAANVAKGATKFKDVSASHWASGYVNLAVDQGIIQGYPDGTFKPSANVTYAEAIAMMVRVLGYEPTLTGSWPTKYIAKASTLNLLEDVAIDNFAGAAPRGAVFQVAYGALSAKPLVQEGYGATAIYKEDTVNLMEKKLNVKSFKDVAITAIPANTAKVGEVVLDGPTGFTDGTYKLATKADVNALWGQTVTVWVKDDKVIHIDSQDKVVAGLVDATATTAKIKVNGTEYSFVGELAGDVADYDNYGPALTAGNTNDRYLAGDEVKLILNAEGKVKAAVKYSYASVLVKNVNLTTGAVEAIEGSGSNITDLKKDGVKVIIAKNGSTATLEDIKAGDVVESIVSTDFRLLIVTSSTTKGKLTAAVNKTVGTEITVDGKTYKTVANPKVSVDGGAKINATKTIKDVMGQDVTLYLNKNGQVYAISAASEVVAAGKEVLLRSLASDEDAATGATKYFFRAVNLADTADVTFYEIDTNKLKVNKDFTLTNSKVAYSHVTDTFNGDAVATTFSLSQANLDADLNVTEVKVDGAVTTAYTVDAVAGTITFSAAPAAGTGNISVTFANAVAQTEDLVEVVLTADGKVEKVKAIAKRAVHTGNATVDKDNKRITLNGVAYSVTDATKFYNVYTKDSNRTYEVTNWDAVKNNATITATSPAEIEYVYNGNQLVKVVFNSNTTTKLVSATTTSTLAVVTGTGLNSAGKDIVTLLTKDGSVSYEFTTGTVANWETLKADKKVISYTLKDGKINTDPTLAATDFFNLNSNEVKVTRVEGNVVFYKVVSAYDSTKSAAEQTVTGDELFIYAESGVEVFDVAGTPAYASLADVVGKVILFQDGGDTDTDTDAIAIIKK